MGYSKKENAKANKQILKLAKELGLRVSEVWITVRNVGQN